MKANIKRMLKNYRMKWPEGPTRFYMYGSNDRNSLKICKCGCPLYIEEPPNQYLYLGIATCIICGNITKVMPIKVGKFLIAE